MMESSSPVARIAVIEKDDATRDLIVNNLVADRFQACATDRLDVAEHLIVQQKPDLIVIEPDLPDGTGLDLIREIREEGASTGRFNPDMGIIILSGRHGERDRIRGLEQGADDYLVKPFSYGELHARIMAVLRRRLNQRSERVDIGNISLNRTERWVKIEGQAVRLSKIEFDLLETLAQEPTRVFSKQELLKAVWGYENTESHSRTLEAHASRLRRKLDPDRGRYVLNCWGVGYRLLAP